MKWLNPLKVVPLKVVSTTFLLVCFSSLKESYCETWKNVFYFTSKALFILEKIKFWNFRYSSFMTSSNALRWNKKYISLNNLGSKHSLLMKFGQFMPNYKRKKIIKKFNKTWDLETSSRPFCVCNELGTTSIGKWNFWSKLLILDMY